MPQLKRRHFFQLAGSAIAAVSLNSCKTRKQPHPLDPNLPRSRQSSSRQLALLVGINTYPPNSHIPNLNGCLTDVELQRHLLIYRFGFNPKDILTLTNAQATRSNILSKFEDHLIKQAKPGDMVVFHYSGHGSQVADPDRDYPDGLNSTLVPFDSLRPTTTGTGGIVQDITGHTLFLLMAALQTENVTVVLDCCHSGGAKRGNLQIRSINGGAQFQASPQEREYQQQWLRKLNLTPDEFKQQRRSGVAKGVVITATKRNQLAAEYPFADFTAGAFTYLMSQYLWQLPDNQPIINTLPNIARSTTQLSFQHQTPEFEVKPGSGTEQQPVYFIDQLTSSAEAVITNVEGNAVELWLGGIDAQSRAAFQKDAIFAVVDDSGQLKGRVQLESRKGLIGRGKLLEVAKSEVIQPGAMCLEQVRVIPSYFSLRIGLDPSLGKDTAQAQASLKALKRIEAVPLQQEEVHYIFGRMTDTYRQELLSKHRESSPLPPSYSLLPPTASLGLFSPGLDLIPGSFGAAQETVTDAVLRLQAKFKSLLAARLVKMILNTDSSQLKITASLHRADIGKQLIANVFPTRGVGVQLVASVRGSVGTKNITKATPSGSSFSEIPLRTAMQLQIANKETRPLYVSVLVIDSTGEMTLIFPNQWAGNGEATRVEVGQTLLVPDPSRDSFNLQTQEPLGVTEVLIIASVTPMQKALKAMQAIASHRNQLSGPVSLAAPIEVIDNLLSDLAQNDVKARNQSIPPTQKIHSVDTTQLAAMSMTFEVI